MTERHNHWIGIASNSFTRNTIKSHIWFICLFTLFLGLSAVNMSLITMDVFPAAMWGSSPASVTAPTHNTFLLGFVLMLFSRPCCRFPHWTSSFVALRPDAGLSAESACVPSAGARSRPPGLPNINTVVGGRFRTLAFHPHVLKS